MEKEKLILSINNNKFYLSIPNEIKIGEIISNCDDLKFDINIDSKYLCFFKDTDIAYTSNEKIIGQEQIYGSIYLIYQYFNNFIIPSGTFELNRYVFNRLKEILKNYDNIFEIELKEYYGNCNFKIDSININYEMIKLENPIKNKNYLFRLKDNNIPKNWVEQSEYLIKRLENLNSKYGNISQNKINLIDFEGCIPKNIDFVINEEYAKRLDDLFKSWNDGNKKSKRMKLVEYLFNIYENDVTSNKEYYSIKVDERITLLVDVEKLEILEFKTMYHNIDISSYYKLSECVKNIQKEIDNIKLS